MRTLGSWMLRWLGWTLAAAAMLQLYFVGRIAVMAVVDPQSTAFERSEAWRVLNQADGFRWRQQWTPYAQISPHLKRAVVASEDDGFVNHDGVDWAAVEKAWERNARAQERAAQAAAANPAKQRTPKVYGGSTITQQLAKNLFLSGERTFLRKGQELLLALALDAILSKDRILEIYLNSVEWGEGIFGAQAAAQHYYGKPASALTAPEAARLAVMLPRPKYFEKLPNSRYVAGRAQVILQRMPSADIP